MIHSEQQYKMLEQQLQKMKKENELKDKEIKNLKTQNKQKDEVICICQVKNGPFYN